MRTPNVTIIKATTFAAVALFSISASATTIVTDWNNAALEEVRLSKALRNGQPMVARASAIAHTCMYDAWAQLDDVAGGTVWRLQPRPPAGSDPGAAKSEAISFAG